MKHQEVKNTICQSCAMPLKRPEDFGFNEDGSKNKEFCCFCLENGKFTNPEYTVDQMIKKVTEIMEGMHLSKEVIEQTRKCIPSLKRWQ